MVFHRPSALRIGGNEVDKDGHGIRSQRERMSLVVTIIGMR